MFPREIQQLAEISGWENSQAYELGLDYVSACIQFTFKGDRDASFENLHGGLKRVLGFRPSQLAAFQKIGKWLRSKSNVANWGETCHFEDGSKAREIDTRQDNSASVCDWLKKFGCLGGTTGILYTIAQMERIRWTNIDWKELRDKLPKDNKTPRSILDRLFITDLLPRMASCSYDWDYLPGVSEKTSSMTLCMPVLRILRGYLFSPSERYVGFAAAFGVHAMVSGTVLLQDKDRCKRLAVLTKLSVRKFDNQFAEVMAGVDEGPYTL